MATASVAAAQDKAKARQLYTEGAKHYYLNEYAEALDAFKRAYWNYEEPSFLYNIAQCYRALDRKGEAIDFYRSYLRKSPDARNRDEVLRTIAELETAVAQERASASPPGAEHAAATTPAARPAERAPPSGQASAPTKPASPALQLVGSGRATTADRPAWKKRWVWGVVAGAVVVAAGVAVGIGVAASPHDPAPSLGNVKVN